MRLLWVHDYDYDYADDDDDVRKNPGKNIKYQSIKR
jgi:hypothetical protein